MTATKQLATPYIDGDAHHQNHWTAEEANNARVVVDFLQHLMNEHDVAYIRQTYGHSAYRQHNRAIPNGIHGVAGYVEELTKRFPEYSYDVKRVIASGDFVVTHSHATLKAKQRGDASQGFIITDTFRLEHGQLAEHWDAIQPIDLSARFIFLMTGGTIANDNPTF
ncbi:MAG: nuclear transport factor 2 family protein [Bacteroidota bacterium]